MKRPRTEGFGSNRAEILEKEGRKGRIISEVIEEKEAKVMYVVDVEPEDKTIGMDTFLPTRQPYAEEFSVLLRSYDIVQDDSFNDRQGRNAHYRVRPPPQLILPVVIVPSAYCMMYWTREPLNTLSRLIGPMFDWDANLLIETTHCDGVRVRVCDVYDGQNDEHTALRLDRLSNCARNDLPQLSE